MTTPITVTVRDQTAAYPPPRDRPLSPHDDEAQTVARLRERGAPILLDGGGGGGTGQLRDPRPHRVLCGASLGRTAASSATVNM